MHQTISGEILKTNVLKKEYVDEFLKHDISIFNKLFNENRRSYNVVYENKNIINDHVLNYLNASNKFDVIKDLIRKEFDECEKIYPYLGDIFVNFFFNKITNKNRLKFKFSKEKEKNFIDSLGNIYSKEIAKLIFQKSSLEYTINFEAYEGNTIILEKSDNISFEFDFDKAYYSDTNIKKIKDYNCIVIDGIIDTIGEIHHLLHQASLNKENYVIFCLGVNDEVKNTILTNNKRKITKVWPIDITSSEKTLNILNDIAIVHDVEVISALKGQTISQEVKKDLKKCNCITINNNNITLIKMCSNESLSLHKNFLLKRIEDSPNEENTKLLKSRYRNISNKTISIYLPKIICNNEFVREVDYLMIFLSNLNKVFTNIKIKNKKYYIPVDCIEIAKEKAVTTKKIIKNIDKVIIQKEKK